MNPRAGKKTREDRRHGYRVESHFCNHAWGFTGHCEEMRARMGDGKAARLLDMLDDYKGVWHQLTTLNNTAKAPLAASSAGITPLGEKKEGDDKSTIAIAFISCLQPPALPAAGVNLTPRLTQSPHPFRLPRAP